MNGYEVSAIWCLQGWANPTLCALSAGTIKGGRQHFKRLVVLPFTLRFLLARAFPDAYPLWASRSYAFYLATQFTLAPLQGSLPALSASVFLLHLCRTNTYVLLGTLTRLRAEHLYFVLWP